MMRPVSKLLWSLLAIAALTACSTALEVAEPPPDPSVDAALDPGVLSGQLNNGFRYYLRSANGAPQNNRLEVRFVVKAGSLHERRDQRGYAHLLEHMAFRGTKSFSAESMELLLNRNGLRWGRDVNATTHYGATVYRFSLKQSDASLLPSLFELMAEWLVAMQIDATSLAQEQRIVDAELRERYADRGHVVDPVTASAYAGSKYAGRQPAGDIDRIRAATVEGLREFWQSRYQPFNAALVITGSDKPWLLDPLIKRAFATDDALGVHSADATDANAENGRDVSVASTDRPGIMFYHDGSTIELLSNSDPTRTLPRLSVNFISNIPQQDDTTVARIERRFRNQLVFNVYSHLVRRRLVRARGCSTVALSNSLLESGQTVEHIGLDLLQEDLLPCLTLAHQSVSSVQESSLTDEEFAQFSAMFDDIARMNIDQYRNRNAAQIADGLVDMVSTGETVLSAWSMQNILERVVDELDRSELNRVIAEIGESHRTVYSLTTNQGRPLAMDDLIAAVSTRELPLIAARQSRVIHGNLKSDQSTLSIAAPKDSQLKWREPAYNRAGSSPVTKTASAPGYHEWLLGNGATVILLPDTNSDQIAVTAISSGGYAGQGGYGGRDKVSSLSARSLPDFLAANGVGGYTSFSLRNIMDNGQFYARPFVDVFSHGITGSTHVDDLSGLLTLISAYFSEPLIVEPQSSIFLQLLNEKKTPSHRGRFEGSMSGTNRVGHSESVSIGSMRQVYQQMFSSTATYAFVFAGALEADELEEQLPRLLIGSSKAPRVLPSTNQYPADLGYRVNHGDKNSHVSVVLTCPDTSGIKVNAAAGKAAQYQNWKVLADVIADRARLSLREQLGLIYEFRSDVPAADQLLLHMDFSVALADEKTAKAALLTMLTELSIKGVSVDEVETSVARIERHKSLFGSDYQSVAQERARQWLFDRQSQPPLNFAVDPAEINFLARCIDRSSSQVLLDSGESFKRGIAASNNDRQSAFEAVGE